jgi:Mannosyl-glycoprotein endo-beta-N-acetylglucosaminidase
MSSEQAPKRRSSSIIERSQYAPTRPPVDERRRNLESLGQDRAAIDRAKQEIAEISRQQGGRPSIPFDPAQGRRQDSASAPVQLDDLEVQQRKPLRMVVGSAPQPTPTSGADVPPLSLDHDMAMSDSQSLALEDLPVRAPAAAPKKAQVIAPAPASRAMFERIEHQPARSAAPARPLPRTQSAAYPRAERYESHDPYPYWEAPMVLARSQPLALLLLAVLVCGPLIWMLSQSPKTFISAYDGLVPVATNLFNQAAGPRIAPADVPFGEHSVVGEPSISADDVDSVLAQYNSPAYGTGKTWIALGRQYGIDPAYALAFFIHESSAGTNPRWDGMKPDGSTTHNIGNISCAGYSRCLGRWRDYGSWEEGIEDWYRLIRDEYIQGRGTQTVEQIMPIYAPSIENDVDTYVQTVVTLVDGWRR